MIGVGLNGEVVSSYVYKLDFSCNEKDSYLLILIKLMIRYVEDFVWVNKIMKVEVVFNFIFILMEGRLDVIELRKGKYF